MKMSLLICFVLAMSACGEGSVQVPSAKPKNKPANVASDEPQTSTDPLVEQLRKDVAEVASRPERRVGEIQVQHILIATANGRMPEVSRTRADAEALAAQVYAKVKAGEDFGSLVGEFTDDSPPGIYRMTQVGTPNPPTLYGRTGPQGMVPAFGNVGWRLDVGEVGVAPHHDLDSPYGWHIIKRLK